MIVMKLEAIFSHRLDRKVSLETSPNLPSTGVVWS